uniref:Telomerase RNA component interacting RNase n=1 Tax=Sinocyclocheilus rhinocerous TaxID=307959 RepID=A0A673N4V2_9TELE
MYFMCFIPLLLFFLRPAGGDGAPLRALGHCSGSSGESGGSSPAHGAPKAANAFANDGSFMELFKKKMEGEGRRKGETEEEEEEKTKSSAARVSTMDLVGHDIFLNFGRYDIIPISISSTIYLK